MGGFKNWTSLLGGAYDKKFENTVIIEKCPDIGV